jgi:catechol 2,3-dioxygenase-like lactoylglutathione lyase family enzyme
MGTAGDSGGVAANFVIVTLGVTDLARSVAFYRALGWEQRGDEADGITWFRTSGCWVGLFGYDELAEDIGVDAAPVEQQPSYRGITLAVNLPRPVDVDAALSRFVEVGGRLVKPAARAEWGGYSGYAADPDGHLWELCHNPGFPLDEQGRIQIG